MQKETKEMVCACGISFLAGVLITLIVFGCASHMHHPKMPNHNCPFAKMHQQEGQFKHHNKLMGRPQEPVLVVVPETNESMSQPKAQ